MITSIKLREDLYGDYISVDNGKTLKNFSKVNIFIGSNNSGKSKFLRTLFSDHRIDHQSDDIPFDEINLLIQQCKEELIELNKVTQNPALSTLVENLNALEFVNILFDATQSLQKPLHGVTVFTGPTSFASQPQRQLFINKVHEIGERYKSAMEKILKDKRLNATIDKKYIPTLRGLRPIGTNGSNPYLDCTVKDYFTGPDFDGTIDQRIYTGLSLYDDLKRLLLSDKSERDKVKNFENFLQKTFFDGKEVNLIPKINSNVVSVRIGEYEERPIYQLGDGIQALIILVYPIFFEQDIKMHFFIEEPEHYLHPGFQRILIETMLSFKNHQYFITTHSNHLLDITLEKDSISVYTFKKGYNEKFQPDFKIENVENDDVNILAEIGVRNSSVFLSNCTIWVEGITDRIYIRKYLDVFQTHKSLQFKEDVHYSFVEYGGNNITHWSFLEDTDENHPNIEVNRLCGKLFLITDKDGDGLSETGKATAKARRQHQLKEKLKERYYCLVAREIENTLSSDVIKKVVTDLEHNAKINFKKAFSGEMHMTEKLGTFLDNNVIGKTKVYADLSGTIKDKLNFAKKAVVHLVTEDDLTSEAKELTSKLYEFIKSNNK
jgi:predicted ATP-dependent endonuclease of OLD family